MGYYFQTDRPLDASSIYVTRENAEKKAVECLTRASSAVVMLIEPALQGKTSFINYVIAHLHSEQHVFVRIDLSNLIDDAIQGEIHWYKALCNKIRTQLGFPARDLPIGKNWESGDFRDTFCRRISTLANQSNKKIVIVFDNIGALRGNCAWTEFFLRAVRSVFTEYHNINFILSGDCHPQDMITSPWGNVGETIRLRDFLYEQIFQLVSPMQLPPEQSMVIAEGIKYWTDGQPYLCQRFCIYLTQRQGAISDRDVDEVARQICQEDSSFFSYILKKLRDDSRLWQTVKAIRDGRSKRRPEVLQEAPTDPYRKLMLLGIIKPGDDQYLRIRNRIYDYLLAPTAEFPLRSSVDTPPESLLVSPAQDSDSVQQPDVGAMPKIGPLGFTPSSLPQEIDPVRNLTERLQTWRAQLAHALKQQAIHSHSTPFSVVKTIGEARDNIREIKGKLRNLGATVDDLPDDEASDNTPT